MTIIEALILGTLAVWRVTHLLQAEDGPGGVLARLRRAAGDGFLGQLMDCFYCLSLWVAVLVAAMLASGWRNGLWLCLAMSGGACLLERATRRPDPFAGVVYEEPREDAHVLR